MFERVMEYYDRHCHRGIPSLQCLLMKNNINFFDENITSSDKRSLIYVMNQIDRCNDDDYQMLITSFHESVLGITFEVLCHRNDIFTMVGRSLYERPFHLYGHEYVMPNEVSLRTVCYWISTLFTYTTKTMREYLKSNILGLFINVIYQGTYTPSRLFDHVKIVNDLKFQFEMIFTSTTTSIFDSSIFPKIILNYCNSPYYKSEMPTMDDVISSISQHSCGEVTEIKNVPELIHLYDTLMSRPE